MIYYYSVTNIFQQLVKKRMCCTYLQCFEKPPIWRLAILTFYLFIKSPGCSKFLNFCNSRLYSPSNPHFTRAYVAPLKPKWISTGATQYELNKSNTFSIPLKPSWVLYFKYYIFHCKLKSEGWEIFKAQHKLIFDNTIFFPKIINYKNHRTNCS